MYFLPHLFDCQDYLDPLENDNIHEFLPTVEEIPPTYSAEFGKFTKTIMTKEGLEMHDDIKICLSLYLFLLEKNRRVLIINHA